MRIVHVYKDYHPVVGGIENHIKTLAEAQVAAGHDVTVLVTNPAWEAARETINGVRVLRARRLATVASTPLSVFLPILLHRQRADVTHLHFPYPLGELSQLLMGKRPFVITYHSDVVKQRRLLRLYAPLLRRLLARADAIIATSQRYIDTSPWLRPLAAACHVVALSVDPQPFANATPLIAPNGRFTLLFVGQHRYYKGVDDLLAALVGLPDVRLLLGGDGVERPFWQQLCHQLGVSSQVDFVGRVSDADLPRLYASADAFVLPANSRAEAFGKVLLEAMAAGLPCITTEVGTGTSFVVQDGVTGLVVPPRDVAALATAVHQLQASPALRQQMGAAGRQRVRDYFTPQRMVTAVMRIYEEVLGV